MYAENPSIKKQLNHALESDIPFMVVFGDAELEQGVVQVKRINPREERVVPKNELVQTLVELGCGVPAWRNATSAVTAAASSAASTVASAAVDAKTCANLIVEGENRAVGRFARPKGL